MNGGKKILYVVDGSSIYRFLVKQVVKSLIGPYCEVHEFASIKVAIAHLSNMGLHDTKSLNILLDLDMSQRAAWDFVNAYQALGLDQHGACLYVTSTFDETLNKQKVKEYPSIRAYIAKPFTIQEFQSFIALGANK